MYLSLSLSLSIYIYIHTYVYTHTFVPFGTLCGPHGMLILSGSLLTVSGREGHCQRPCNDQRPGPAPQALRRAMSKCKGRSRRTAQEEKGLRAPSQSQQRQGEQGQAAAAAPGPAPTDTDFSFAVTSNAKPAPKSLKQIIWNRRSERWEGDDGDDGGDDDFDGDDDDDDDDPVHTLANQGMQSLPSYSCHSTGQ